MLFIISAFLSRTFWSYLVILGRSCTIPACPGSQLRCIVDAQRDRLIVQILAGGDRVSRCGRICVSLHGSFLGDLISELVLMQFNQPGIVLLSDLI